MTVRLRGPHDAGNIIGLSYRLYARHFTPLFLIALVTVPLPMLTAVIVNRIESPDTAGTVSSLLQVPGALVTLVAGAALVRAFHAITAAEKPDAGAALDTGIERFPAFLTTSLLSVVLLFASLLSFPSLAIWWLVRRDATIDGRRDWWLLLPLVLTLYLIGRWLFLAQAVVIEGKRNWSALDASAAAVRGQWWRSETIAVLVVFIGIGPVMLAAAATIAAPALLAATAVAMAAALVFPFTTAALTLLYYDLKARKDTDAQLDVSPA